MQDLKVSVIEILGKPGANRDVSISPTLEGVHVDLARLDPEPVVGDLTLESVIEGVLVTGSLYTVGAARAGLAAAAMLVGRDVDRMDFAACNRAA